MASSDVKLQIVVNARDEASSTLKTIGTQTENLEKQTKNYGNALQGALGFLSAYAGTKGLVSLIDATEESNKQLAQARFFLAGYGDNVDQNFTILKAGERNNSARSASAMSTQRLWPRNFCLVFRK